MQSREQNNGLGKTAACVRELPGQDSCLKKSCLGYVQARDGLDWRVLLDFGSKKRRKDAALPSPTGARSELLAATVILGVGERCASKLQDHNSFALDMSD